MLYFRTGRYVLSGSHDGSVLVWDTNEEPHASEDSSEPFLHPILPYKAHEDTVNGIRCDHLYSKHIYQCEAVFKYSLYFSRRCHYSFAISVGTGMRDISGYSVVQNVPVIRFIVWKPMKLDEIYRF